MPEYVFNFLEYNVHHSQVIIRKCMIGFMKRIQKSENRLVYTIFNFFYYYDSDIVNHWHNSFNVINMWCSILYFLALLCSVHIVFYLIYSMDLFWNKIIQFNSIQSFHSYNRNSHFSWKYGSELYMRNNFSCLHRMIIHIVNQI